MKHVRTMLILALGMLLPVRGADLWTQGFEASNSEWNVAIGEWGVNDQAFTNDAGSYAWMDTLSVAYGGHPEWKDITYSVDMTMQESGDVWLLFRVQDGGNFYIFTFQDHEGYVALYKKEDSLFTRLGTAENVWPESGTTYRMKVEMAGSNFKIYQDDQLILEATDDTYAKGMVGVGANRSLGKWDNIRVEGEGPVVSIKTAHRNPMYTQNLGRVVAVGSRLRIEVFPGPGYLAIFDARGALLQRRSLSAASSTRFIDVPFRGANGSYVIRLESGPVVLAKRMIVVR